MSQIGQIIYNVEDYAGHGGLVSSNADDPFTNDYVIEEQSGKIKNLTNDEPAQKINIYKNILEQCNISKIIKLGIQAPPGTKFILNSQNIESDNSLCLIIGRTGIYELDLSGEGANDLTYLKFIKPQHYILDETESFTRTSEGITKMNESKINFDKKVNDLRNLYGSAGSGTETNDVYWKEYDQYFQEYCLEYEGARALYLQGMNGVYRKGSEGDLSNIIIDFYYEPETASTES